MEKLARKKYNITRFELIIHPKNQASRAVALKSGYKKEGKLKGIIPFGKQRLEGVLYGKVVN